MLSASVTVICLIDSTNSARASGTAASAARFIAVASASTSRFRPSLRSVLRAFSSLPGSGMRTSGLPRKPSGLPSAFTATSVAWFKASFSAALRSCAEIFPSAEARPAALASVAPAIATTRPSVQDIRIRRFILVPPAAIAAPIAGLPACLPPAGTHNRYGPCSPSASMRASRLSKAISPVPGSWRPGLSAIWIWPIRGSSRSIERCRSPSMICM